MRPTATRSGILHSGKSCRGKSSSSLAADRDPLSRTVKPSLVATSATACFPSSLFPHRYTWSMRTLVVFKALQMPPVRGRCLHYFIFTPVNAFTCTMMNGLFALQRNEHSSTSKGFVKTPVLSQHQIDGVGSVPNTTTDTYIIMCFHGLRNWI